MSSEEIGEKFVVEPGAFIAGRYEVVKVLGSGAMSTVLQAIDRTLNDETVALKILLPHLARDEVSFARFKNEAQIARRLFHPSIVRLFDFGDAGSGYYYISMELVQSGTLTDLIYRSKRIDFEKTLQILYFIAHGLAHAHQHGVIHRDLKPDNILLDAQGNVKIADFGLARTLYADRRFTTAGETVGTPYYMAPEQLLGNKVDGRADIYAFGLIAYELAVGALPFDADNYLQLAELHMSCEIPSFAATTPGCPQWFEEFVRKCSAKRVEDRYQSAQEIVEVLKPYTPEGYISSTLDFLNSVKPPLPVSGDLNTGNRQRALTISAAALLLIVAATAGWYSQRHAVPRPLPASTLAAKPVPTPLAVNYEVTGGPQIRALIDGIAKSQLQFIRNGQALSAEEFAVRMAIKYRDHQHQVRDVPEFISRLATKSGESKEPYLVRMPDGELLETREWLTREAKHLQAIAREDK